MKGLRCWLLCFVVAVITLCYSSEGTCSTVSGQVVIPFSDMGYRPDIYGMKARVEGTEISADVTAVGNKFNGEFTLNDVPTGAVTLLLIESSPQFRPEAGQRHRIGSSSY